MDCFPPEFCLLVKERQRHLVVSSHQPVVLQSLISARELTPAEEGEGRRNEWLLAPKQECGSWFKSIHNDSVLAPWYSRIWHEKLPILLIWNINTKYELFPAFILQFDVAISLQNPLPSIWCRSTALIHSLHFHLWVFSNHQFASLIKFNFIFHLKHTGHAAVHRPGTWCSISGRSWNLMKERHSPESHTMQLPPPHNPHWSCA